MDTRAPIHFVTEMAASGYSKQLALFLSLKKIFSSSHIHNFKKLDLSLVGYRISRPTYFKYLRTLERLQLVKSDGKSGMILTGQNKIVELYPVPNNSKLKYVHLPNDKNLRDSIERVVVKRNLECQTHKMREPHHYKLFGKILSTVNGVVSESYENLRETTSLSCKKLAYLIGLSSAMTGVRREKRWRESGFINTQKRLYVVCDRLREDAKELLLQHPRNFRYGERIVRRIANGIEVRDTGFGKRREEKQMSSLDFFLLHF